LLFTAFECDDEMKGNGRGGKCNTYERDSINREEFVEYDEYFSEDLK
jgi:hypothetical protein